MPVILSGDNEKRWLEKGLDTNEIRSMLEPYNSADMQAYPVERSIIKLGFNTKEPSILQETEYSNLTELTITE
jgi:putative SOS response-associated peptidase YedK